MRMGNLSLNGSTIENGVPLSDETNLVHFLFICRIDKIGHEATASTVVDYISNADVTFVLPK